MSPETLYKTWLREYGGIVPVWIYMGRKLAMPWSWFLTVPGLIWIAGFMLVDRLRHARPSPPGEPLRQCVESSLAQIEHQIWLLSNIFWWYLLPPGVPMLAFVGHLIWLSRGGGWLTAVALGPVAAVVVAVLAGIYWLNRSFVRTNLIPRRDELRMLLASLGEEQEHF